MSRIKHFLVTTILVFVFLLFGSVEAQIRLPRLISDGMVLQRGVDIKLWGWANPGEKLSVNFRDFEGTTVCDSNGNWELIIPPQQAGGPFELLIQGSTEVIVKDILCGDVWLCSGQSNIQTPMSRLTPLYPNEIANSENKYVRYFAVPEAYNFNERQSDFQRGNWMHTNPQNVPVMGGVPYFFAKYLYEKYQIPIGIINASVGGSPIEAWLSEDAIKNYPEKYSELVKWQNDSLVAATKTADNARMSNWYRESIEKDIAYANDGISWLDADFDDSNWESFEMPSMLCEANEEPENGVYWFRRKFSLSAEDSGRPAQLELGRMKDADSVFINKKYVGSITYEYPPRRYTVPEGILQAGENILVVRLVSSNGRGGFIPDKPYNIKVAEKSIDLSGDWKYTQSLKMPQLDPETFIRWKPTGLYNSMLAPNFTHAIKGVVWYQGEANTFEPEKYSNYFKDLVEDWRKNWHADNLPFLYVQLPNFMETKSEPSESDWAMLRDVQRRALEIENSAMAVTIELGEWNDIHPKNKKEVARRLFLNARHLVYGEEKLVYSGPLFEKMEVRGNQAVLSFTNIGSGLIVKGGGTLKYFSIAGEDGKFVWAQARIEGDEVIVWSDQVENPIEVRYAWADNPEGANLYNSEGLPASPFSTAAK